MEQDLIQLRGDIERDREGRRRGSPDPDLMRGECTVLEPSLFCRCILQ
jgi:hypothetical protein